MCLAIVDKEQLKRQVHIEDLHFLYVRLCGLNAEWQQYGIALHVNFDILQEIERKPGKSTARDKMTAVLNLWEKSKGKKTWKNVYDSVKQMRNIGLAQTIESKYNLTMEVPMNDTYPSEMLILLNDVIADWEPFGLGLGLPYLSLIHISEPTRPY